MTGLLLTVLLGDALAADAAAGKSIYMTNCMSCHGANADGNGPAAMALQPAPTDFTDPGFWAGKSEADIKSAIRSGRPGTSMMGFSQLSQEDVNNITAFLSSKKP